MKKVIILSISIVIIISSVILINQFNSQNMYSEDIEYVDSTKEIDQILLEIEEKNKENNYQPKPREWQYSGPFSIDRKEYVLGEKIFINIQGLKNEEKGAITVVRMLNQTHFKNYISIPFDGEKKNQFNHYIQPAISKNRNLCSSQDIIGNWIMFFENTEYAPIYFKINEQILPGDEYKFEKIVC